MDSQAEIMHKRSPGLAAVLSLLVPGAGQIYNGQLGKGILILFTWWLVIPWIYGIFNAYSTAKKVNSGDIKPKAASSGCAIALIVGLGLTIVFVAIIGLLAAIAIPNFIKARNEAQANAAGRKSPPMHTQKPEEASVNPVENLPQN